VTAQTLSALQVPLRQGQTLKQWTSEKMKQPKFQNETSDNAQSVSVEPADNLK